MSRCYQSRTEQTSVLTNLSGAIALLIRALPSALIVVGTVSLLTGCGPSGPKLVPVEGIVTLDGEPLAFKSLLFLPADGTDGNGAGGFTDGQGKFSLIGVVFGATSDFRGCPPGRYRVVVSESTIPLSEADFQSSRRNANGREPEAAIGPMKPATKSEIPSRYTSAQSTPLVLEVPESGGTLNIELTSALN